MSKIAVVTDSTATIPEELVKKYNIYVAPLSITWDKVRYRDGVDLTASEFYQRLRKSDTLPTTSSAMQGEFLQIFESLQGKVDGIVAVVLTGDLGAAYNSAMSAKEMVPDVPIEVIDSKQATTALGFMAIEAAKVAAGGGTLEEVAKAARDMLPKVHCFLALDTLEYLKRGGRVSMPQALLAGWLNVKPIMELRGKIEPVAKPRSHKKKVETLINLMKERVKDTPLHVAIMHADFAEAAEDLKKKITAEFNPAEILMSEVTPVVGTHFGPDSLAIAFYNE
jgi:DegV family protein with EDD domain